MAIQLPLILIVEDDRATSLFIEECLKERKYKVIKADNGKDAIEIIAEKHQSLFAIILDRMLPDMDGVEVVRWMKNNKDISKVPIIMQTSADKPSQVKEGVDLGVFYYLVKPIVKEILNSVVLSAIKETKQHRLLKSEIKNHKSSFGLIEKASFKLQTLNEVNNLSCFISNSFPNPYKILPAIAELLVNAVEHGNCGITYDEKTKLVETDKWKEEVDRRCNLEENKSKFVEVLFSKTNEDYSISISDKGPGFNWPNYLRLDPSRALDLHGRGIARANMIFDILEYHGNGNKVVGKVKSANKDNFKW